MYAHIGEKGRGYMISKMHNLCYGFLMLRNMMHTGWNVRYKLSIILDMIVHKFMSILPLTHTIYNHISSIY